MSNVLTAAKPLIAAGQPVRVMIVDDAIVVRRLLARWVVAEHDMMVAACLRTGREAVDQVEECDPDVVVLDVDMPELDGISALPLLLRKKRDLVVIMASTLTRRSAEVSLRALSLGAADYVPKPEAAPDATTSAAFQRELIDKIRHLGRRGRFFRAENTAPALHRAVPVVEHAAPHAEAVPIRLRSFAPVVPRVLLIGSSTGGPQALTSLIGQMGMTMERAPVLITQHMPPTFTTVLAEHLTRVSGRSVREAEHDEAGRGRPHLCGARRPAHALRRAGAPRLRSAMIRRSIFAGLRLIRCFPRRRKCGGRQPGADPYRDGHGRRARRGHIARRRQRAQD